MRQLAAVSSPFALGAALLVGLWAPPAAAAPADVRGMTYDGQQRQIAIGLAGTVSVRTQRLKHPDRLVIDLSEARLPIGQPLPLVHVPAGNVRSVRIGQHSYFPPVVRVVVDLNPDFEPMVKIEQSAEQLRITLANPPLPSGEKDLETLPFTTLPGIPVSEPASSPAVTHVPAPPALPILTPPESLPNPPSHPPAPPASPSALPPASEKAAPIPAWTPPPMEVPTAPTPAWTPPPVPAWTPPPASEPDASPPGLPTPAPWSAPPRQADPPAGTAPPAGVSEEEEAREDADAEASRSVIPPARRPSESRSSNFQLRWQQIETLEEYGAPEPSFAYPAGINGFDFEHWFWPYLGAGFDTRILFYDLTVESVRQHRTDAMLGTYLALRYPFAFLEPSLRLGYMGRSVTVESESTGTSFAFSPLQTYFGPTVTGKLAITLLPGFGLDLHAKLMPQTQGSLYPGFPSVFPLSGSGWGASLVTDFWQGYVSLGYSSEQAVNADGSFKQTFGGITMGMGLRY